MAPPNSRYQSYTTEQMERFRDGTLRIGAIYRRDELEYLLFVAKQCLAVGGLPLAASGGASSTGMGTISIHGAGPIPGWVAATLAGMLAGTALNVTSQLPLKLAFDEILLRRYAMAY